MKQQFATFEESNIFIDKINVLFGFPDETNGTLTYAVLEEVKDKDGNVICYRVEISQVLSEKLVEIAINEIMK